MSSVFEKVVAALLTSAAVVLAVTFAHREFVAPPVVARPSPDVAVFQKGWEESLKLGHSTGDSSSVVRVVEFSDLECPFCATSYLRFHSDTSQLAQRYRGRVSYTFMHFPLNMHRFARPAARAAECAGLQGKFFEFVGGVFARQDSLGLKSWAAYAQDAGINDLARFEACASASTALVPADAGVALGKRLSIESTPAVLINGWKFTGVMSESTYVAVLDSILLNKARVGAR